MTTTAERAMHAVRDMDEDAIVRQLRTARRKIARTWETGGKIRARWRMAEAAAREELKRRGWPDDKVRAVVPRGFGKPWNQ